MKVITLEHLSHLPKGVPFLSVGLVADAEAALKIGEKYQATTVYYWPKTKSAYLYIPKETNDGAHETV